MNKRNKSAFITGCLMLGSFFLASCSVSEKSKTREELSEITGQTRNNWSERKTDFVKESENAIENMESDLTMFQGTVNQSRNRKYKEKMTGQLKDLKEDLVDLREELNSLRKVGPEDWEDERSDFLTAMNEAERDFEVTRNQIVR